MHNLKLPPAYNIIPSFYSAGRCWHLYSSLTEPYTTTRFYESAQSANWRPEADKSTCNYGRKINQWKGDCLFPKDSLPKMYAGYY
jgi:hypothetical protein